MAAVIGRTQGYTARGPEAGEATRLGSEYVRSEANTWHTFVRVEVRKDGRLDVEVRRDGQPTLYLTVNAEDAGALCYHFSEAPNSKSWETREIASTWTLVSGTCATCGKHKDHCLCVEEAP